MSLRIRAPQCNRAGHLLSRSCCPPGRGDVAHRPSERLADHLHRGRKSKHQSAVQCRAAKVEEVESVQESFDAVAAVLFDMDGVLCNSEELSRKYAPGQQCSSRITVPQRQSARLGVSCSSTSVYYLGEVSANAQHDGSSVKRRQQ